MSNFNVFLMEIKPLITIVSVNQYSKIIVNQQIEEVSAQIPNAPLGVWAGARGEEGLEGKI